MHTHIYTYNCDTVWCDTPKHLCMWQAIFFWWWWHWQGKLFHWKGLDLFKNSFYLFIYFCFFRAAPLTYGSSQAKGRIQSCSCLPTPQPSETYTTAHWQCWIPHPLSKAGDGTHILVDTSRIRFHCATAGTPRSFFKSRKQKSKTKQTTLGILRDVVIRVRPEY